MTEAARHPTRPGPAPARALPISPGKAVGPVPGHSAGASIIPVGPAAASPGLGSPAPVGDVRPQAWISAFPARPDQVRHARHGLARALGECGCPATDDVLLCLSELASNAVLHSASRLPGGTFTVRADIRPGQYIRIEVHDRGGAWNQTDHSDGRLHGLAIVRALADDAGVRGDESTGWTAWAQLTWARSQPTRPLPH